MLHSPLGLVQLTNHKETGNDRTHEVVNNWSGVSNELVHVSKQIISIPQISLLAILSSVVYNATSSELRPVLDEWNFSCAESNTNELKQRTN